MASGKETPRQKMIGMMYLVLTALLALNVSKEVLKGFVTVNESIENSKQNLDENNARVVSAFEKYVKQGNVEAEPYFKKIVAAKTHFNSIQNYIDSLKLQITKKTEGGLITDTSQLRFMQKLDDYDTPTYILIGSEASKPINTKYSAYDLKNKLNDFHLKLIYLLDSMQINKLTKIDENDMKDLKRKLNTIKPNDTNKEQDGMKITWEIQNFYHMPMAAVVTNLNKIQADIKNVETDFIHVFANASSKFIFKIDRLRAEVIASSAYVLSGDEFKANIVLGASSSELTNDRMKVFVDAEYDTLTNKIIQLGKEIKVSEGIGKFETIASSIGEKNLKGVVVYKNPRGIDEFYPFDFKYMVAPPYSAVAADNMNIFYVGVDNPISFSAAGFSPADLKLTVKGCGAEIKAFPGGKFVLNAKNTGTCEVIVMAKTVNGFKQQGAPKIFRVKSIPPPVLKVGGKLAVSNLEFTKSELGMIGGLGAESPGFMFPVNMVVKSFDLEIHSGASIEPYQCNSNNLTQAAKQALNRMRVGQKAYIDNIKVQTPTGIISLPMTQLKVKS